MRFAFIPHESLPRLAWCAHVRRGSETVEIHHGPWVETAGDWFVEGAWTGPFSSGGVVEAIHLVGTAGRAEEDQVVFCSPTNLCDRVQSVQAGEDLYVSNSLPFLLEITGDKPDPLYLDYGEDRRRQQMAGISLLDKRLPTARGRQIFVHDYCNVAVRKDLSIRRLEKPATPPPTDYRDYVGQLEATIAAVQANGADPLRRHRRYRPLATVSRGYDSNAMAVLMRRHGAEEALTFTHADDDGTAVAERLGYKVTGYEPGSFLTIRGSVEAEFQATPWGADAVMAACEAQLAGALLMTGRHGGIIADAGSAAPPDLRSSRYNSLMGAQMSEFRLRVGFLHFLPYLVAALHPEAIHRISLSSEMKPWSVGGDYDRPILRRIIEEAGVPREYFGQRKVAGASGRPKRPADLTADSLADFTAFSQTLPPVSRGRRRLHRVREIIHTIGVKMSRRHRRIRAALGLSSQQVHLVHGERLGSLTRNTPVDLARLFHWGCAHVQPRYTLKARD